MNWTGRSEKRSVVVERELLSQHLLRGTAKYAVRVLSVSAEVRMGKLPDTSEKRRYRFNQLVGNISVLCLACLFGGRWVVLRLGNFWLVAHSCIIKTEGRKSDG
jgi:hypothetical protein